MLWRDGNQYYKRLRQKGIIPEEYPDLKYNAQLNNIVHSCISIFRSRVKAVRLKLVYLYSMKRQHKQFNNLLGICSKFKTGGYTIGIAIEALERGENYSIAVFLHELAHMITSQGHTKEFYLKLNELIDQYNRETGKEIKAIGGRENAKDKYYNTRL
ncbi:MAG: hypothetical protein JG777_3076 [Clostridia bacterium]|jgi:predicted metal-dependent hydrolase|uniref:Wss1p-related putative metallopeptidase n=1 Tax=Petroclostridium xylanilyticum TaxID=1792311 RepID=UPI000B992E23|nr:Wss1p-related putative metallopeptidase [Petroclostridium xylanilyticum]MBZ4647587.1 hypothetical protein [Clostridia bacterium]